MAVGVTPQTVQRRWEHLSEASLAVGETSASNWPTCDTAWSELLCARLSQCGKPTSPTPEGDGVEKDAQGRGESSFGPCADEEHGEGLLRSARIVAGVVVLALHKIALLKTHPGFKRTRSHREKPTMMSASVAGSPGGCGTGAASAAHGPAGPRRQDSGPNRRLPPG